MGAPANDKQKGEATPWWSWKRQVDGVCSCRVQRGLLISTKKKAVESQTGLAAGLLGGRIYGERGERTTAERINWRIERWAEGGEGGVGEEGEEEDVEETKAAGRRLL